MRYVCYKTVVSKLIDQEIKDISAIKELIKVFFDNDLSCSLRYKDGRIFSSARIIKVSDNDFEFHAVESRTTFKKTVPYQDLEFLELKTDDQVISVLKPHCSRWLLLDIDSALGD